MNGTQYMHLVRALVAEHEGGEAESNHVANTHATVLHDAYERGTGVDSLFALVRRSHPTHVSGHVENYNDTVTVDMIRNMRWVR